MAKAKQAAMTDALAAALTEWQTKCAALAEIKKSEFELRQQIINIAGFQATKLEGTETLDLGGGWKLKAVKVQSYKADKDAVMNLLNYLGNNLKRGDLAQNLIEWKPDVKTAIYKKEVIELAASDDNLKRLLALAIEIKPGAPQLELVAPEPEDEPEKQQ